MKKLDGLLCLLHPQDRQPHFQFKWRYAFPTAVVIAAGWPLSFKVFGESIVLKSFSILFAFSLYAISLLALQSQRLLNTAKEVDGDPASYNPYHTLTAINAMLQLGLLLVFFVVARHSDGMMFIWAAPLWVASTTVQSVVAVRSYSVNRTRVDLAVFLMLLGLAAMFYCVALWA